MNMDVMFPKIKKHNICIWYMTCLIILHKTSRYKGRVLDRGFIMPTLFGKTFDLLTGVLDYRAAKHKVIVSNIANIDTAGFKPQELLFKKNLAEAISADDKFKMACTDKAHFPLSENEQNEYQTEQKADKVDIDGEMSSLAENNLMYNATVELLARKFRGLETALKEIK